MPTQRFSYRLCLREGQSNSSAHRIHAAASPYAPPNAIASRSHSSASILPSFGKARAGDGTVHRLRCCLAAPRKANPLLGSREGHRRAAGFESVPAQYQIGILCYKPASSSRNETFGKPRFVSLRLPIGCPTKPDPQAPTTRPSVRARARIRARCSSPRLHRRLSRSQLSSGRLAR